MQIKKTLFVVFSTAILLLLSLVITYTYQSLNTEASFTFTHQFSIKQGLLDFFTIPTPTHISIPTSVPILTEQSETKKPTETNQNIPECGTTEVAFVIDTTASLSNAFSLLKSELADILNLIKSVSNNKYRIALVGFDIGVKVYSNFEDNNATQIDSQIKSIRLIQGGYREPEPSDEAMNTVINSLGKDGRTQNIDFKPGFGNDSTKIIIFVTDAHPGGFNETYTPSLDLFSHTLAEDAKKKEISILSIFVPTPLSDKNNPASIVKIMQDYASTTNGIYIATKPNGTGIGGSIKDFIKSCGGKLSAK